MLYSRKLKGHCKPGINEKNYIQKIKIKTKKRCMHCSVHCSTIYNSQDRETTWMSIDRGLNKEEVVHTFSEILLSHNKWNTAIGSNIDATRDYHTEWNKSDKDKYHISLMCRF